MADRILVTGASGFVGRHLVAALEASGFSVLRHSSADGDIATARLSYADVCHVYHLAARSFVPDSWERPREFYQTNVIGTVNVLEFCRRTKASVTVISSYVYGQPSFLPISEEHPLAAVNPYGHTKILAEETTAWYTEHFGVCAAIIRPFNIYGPGQSGEFLIPTLLQQALSRECSQIRVRDARPRRDYLFVSDLIALLLRLPGKTGVYNAGSGVSVSVAEVAAVINDVLGTAKPLVSEQDERRAEVMKVVADITKARRELGWEPEVSLADGLRETVAGER